MSELRLCGLGVDPTRDATLEALTALRECAAVFSDGLERRERDWLEGLGVRARPAAGAAQLVDAAAGSPAPVALACWGHAGYTSALAVEARALAARRGLPCRVYAGVSPLGRHVADARLFLGGDKKGRKLGVVGAQSLSAESLLAGAAFETRLPLVVYDPAGLARHGAAVCAALRARYPKDAEVLVYAREGLARPARLAALEAALDGALAAALPEVADAG